MVYWQTSEVVDEHTTLEGPPSLLLCSAHPNILCPSYGDADAPCGGTERSPVWSVVKD